MDTTKLWRITSSILKELVEKVNKQEISIKTLKQTHDENVVGIKTLDNEITKLKEFQKKVERVYPFGEHGKLDLISAEEFLKERG